MILWHYDPPLVSATLQGREKRFLSYATMTDGTEVTAHCPNPGRMTSCMTVGNTIWLTYNPSPKRKLDYTWELSQEPNSLVIVNTQMANRVVCAMLEHNLITQLHPVSIRPEYKVGNSRFDFYIEEQSGQKTLIEVKQVTLAQGSQALFPDAVTQRGRKHLVELSSLAQETEYRCIQLYLVARSDVDSVGFAHQVDPEYARAAFKAQKSGVEFFAYGIHPSSQDIRFRGELPLDWDGPRVIS